MSWRSRQLPNLTLASYFTHFTSLCPFLFATLELRCWRQKALIMTSKIENREEEPEETPRWMRYMPKSKVFLDAQPHNIKSSDQQARGTEKRKIIIRKSSNAFGPTSTHALTAEATLTKDKRKRIDDSHCGIIEESNEERAVRRKVRCRSTNMTEAAELFSIVKLK